jgi:hypothetical protein
MCGASGILFREENHFILFKYVVGQGTNNIAFFYALWLLLKIFI